MDPLVKKPKIVDIDPKKLKKKKKTRKQSRISTPQVKKLQTESQYI